MELSHQHLLTTSGPEGGESQTDTEFMLRSSMVRADAIDLPEGPTSRERLAACLSERRSIRAFGSGAISLAALATLLAEGAGVCARADGLAADAPPGPRPYPSGGRLYPIELSVYPLRIDGLPCSFHYYQPLPNRLIPLQAGDPRDVLTCFANDQAGCAAALLLLWADFSRPSLAKYGGKAYRLLLLEAGHLAQNILLLATALGLASLPICGFDDRRLSTLCSLNYPSQAVTYTIAIGVPA
jgi:SagB-type dehydrogenase family enzyme